MSIKRIKKIQNVGAFSSFNTGGSLEFEKLTFIYGLNTYGKTTLADIFQSLKSNNPEIISSRKTIYKTVNKTISEQEKEQLQEIILSEKNQSEKEINFKNGKWDKNNLHSNIEVFSTGFIDKNLFTGLTIERQNKESFTRFILGEQGVKLAEDIQNKKQAIGQKKKLLNEKCPVFIKDKTEDEKNIFLEFSIENLNKEDIERGLLDKQKELRDIEERLKKPETILELKEPKEYKAPEDQFTTKLDSINQLLEKSYRDIKDEALKRLQQHLESHFTAKEKAENWLREGINYSKDIKNGDCPFCGQSLKDATEIINIYLSYFDSAYTNFINTMENELSKSQQSLKEYNFLEKTKIQEALTKTQKFKELITDSSFHKELNELEHTVTKLKENELTTQKTQILEIVREKCSEKKKAPHKKIESINYDNFKTNLKNYNDSLIDAKKAINQIIDQIQKFKKPYKDISKIKNKITNLETDVKDLEYKKARIEKNQACKEYQQIKEEIDNLNAKVTTLRKQLEQEQFDYLNNYFTKINQLFKRFGSNNFTLSKKIEKRGHIPVCSLTVKFHNKLIDNNDLKTIFSDSDRRALALAIFYAKINLKTDDEKKNLVIILDDPVTSFDDNRITNSINLFKNTIGEVKQIIILTHYPQFIKRFFEMTNNNKEMTNNNKGSPTFLTIEQNEKTSFLKQANKIDFISSEYEKTFSKIYGFINKEHTESIKNDLRPFLENLYLPIFFSKQIQDKKVDCSSLNSMIDGIFNENDKIKKKVHQFRETLNPDSHIMTTNNNEDVRNFAKEMIDYLLNIKLDDK